MLGFMRWSFRLSRKPPSSENETGTGPNGGDSRPEASFRTTHWSAVLTARDKASSQAQQALAELCQTY
jgi:hypothetical protein